MFKFLRLYFDEGKETPVYNDPIKDYGDIEFNPDGSMKIPEYKEPEPAKEEPKVEDKADEVDEKESTEDSESSTEKAVSEGSQEDSQESHEEPKEEPVAGVEKALKDTQRAYHEGQQRIKDLEEKIAKYEKKPDGKTGELTLENIDPSVLREAMAKDPVMTQRWVTDQQVKITLRQQREADQKVKDAEAKTARIAASEEAALKQFPILDKLTKLKDDQLVQFQKDHPEQIEFLEKVEEYEKVFEARGDEEALYNAAARAFAELEPKALEKIKADITKATVKAQENKVKTVKQAGVSSGASSTPKKQTAKPSESEFFKMSQGDQQDAMYADFKNRLANSKQK